MTSSAFLPTTLPIGGFTTSFDFRLVNPNANGFLFTINGVRGAGLPGLGLLNSVAVKFDLSNYNFYGTNLATLYVNGLAVPNAGIGGLPPGRFNLQTGDVFNVTMAYDGNQLTVTTTDKVTGGEGDLDLRGRCRQGHRCPAGLRRLPGRHRRPACHARRL